MGTDRDEVEKTQDTRRDGDDDRSVENEAQIAQINGIKFSEFSIFKHLIFSPSLLVCATKTRPSWTPTIDDREIFFTKLV